VSYAAFAALRDRVLSEPLDRSRALWQIFLVPCLEDGRVGLVGKIHHALVDGIAALQMVGLIVDAPPEATHGRIGSPPVVRPTTSGGAVGRLTRQAGGGLSVLRAAATAATRPAAIAGAAVRDARCVLEAARDELLPAAPSCMLNEPTGGRRTLVGYHAPLADLRAARAGGGTLNDIGLTVVAGALRALEAGRGEAPAAPFKAMVPVSMRKAGETGPGNRISMIYIQLPVHLASPQERLEWVRAQTRRLKDSPRAENMQTLYAAGGLLPAPLRSPIAKAMASARVFNLTISQAPGPRGAVHVLGWAAEEVYSVVPFAERHALAIGMLRYGKELFIGCYADPDALPEVHQLPTLLKAQLRALGRGTHDANHRTSALPHPRAEGTPQHSPAPAGR
jgi:WS/DGAT/MGAT family acyltransferase